MQKIAGYIQSATYEPGLIYDMLGTHDAPLIQEGALLLGSLDPAGSYLDITVLCDAEISNKEELIEEAYSLCGKPHLRLEEAIAALFYHKKENAIKQLKGFFAIVVYDKKEKSLYLFRDRFGAKSLYWAQLGEAFYFCSDLKGLIASNRIDQKLHFESLSFYLFLGYIPQEKTPLCNVYRLLPGYFLLHKEGHDLQIIPYFSLASALENKTKYIQEESLENTVLEEEKGQLSDLYNMVWKTSELMACPSALNTYLDCKKMKASHTPCLIFNTFSPKWFEKKLLLPGRKEAPAFSLKNPSSRLLLGFLSLMDQRASFEMLRKSYTYPYHSQFLEKNGFLKEEDVLHLGASYLKPLDIELFLHRFPSLEKFGPTPLSLIYLFFKTEVPSVYLSMEHLIANAFSLKPIYPYFSVLDTLSDHSSLFPFSNTTLFYKSKGKKERSYPLDIAEFLSACNLLLGGTLLESEMIKKKELLLLKREVPFSESAREKVYLLLVLEFWVQLFIEKSPKAIAKKIREEHQMLFKE